ncbi:hypothetical protein HDU85_002561 [Gaertneriomyces sp. JEL0708]|nr:hypothetical protein HDU85_002561 [Gaertneriomyces sp. JEL0708]
MAQMVGPNGTAVGIEHIGDLAELSYKNVMAGNPSLFHTSMLKFVVGDGRKGYPSSGPFDAIHVGAAADPVPQELIRQLRSPGRMIVPVGKPHSAQILTQIDKTADGKVHTKTIENVIYVPLTSKQQQLGLE